MFDEFRDHIAKNLPELARGKLLLACSGGIDSMVLADLMLRVGFDFALAHCNYKLRGADSDLDEDFVRNWAKKNDVRVFFKTFNLKDQSGSIQTKARELRYDWFRELCATNGFGIIVTAHHANDSLETFLINLSRGTGLSGLLGIPEKNKTVVRPLLPFSREQIAQYAEINALQWREDLSNADSSYLRNKVRHEVVPNLEELHTTFFSNFQTTQNHLNASFRLLEDFKKNLKQKLFLEQEGVIEIRVSGLKLLEPTQDYLHFLLKDYGFSQWEDIADLLDAQSGKEIHSMTHRLIKDRDKLLLVAKNLSWDEIYFLTEEMKTLETPISLKIELVNSFENLDKSTICVDKEKLNYPLKLRKWQNADYFYPLGMKGSKKLSKFFKDQKLNTLEKENQWLLCSNNDIVWVIGRRADERFKVTEKTRQILKFEVIT